VPEAQADAGRQFEFRERTADDQRRHSPSLALRDDNKASESYAW